MKCLNCWKRQRAINLVFIGYLKHQHDARLSKLHGKVEEADSRVLLGAGGGEAAAE